MIVAGASSHPGKFGFVVLHNILRHGYAGKVFATNIDGGEILGVTADTSVECVPDGAADLVLRLHARARQCRRRTRLRAEGGPCRIRDDRWIRGNG